MMALIDTHAHLDEVEGLEEALAEASTAGVAAIIAVGSDLASNRKVLEIGRTYPGFVYPALGLHPWNIKADDLEATLEFIEANTGRAVAIGEVGLDYHKKVLARADKDLQSQVFKSVLAIARRHGKPALIHSRYAWRDALDAVRGTGVEKAVFHWYTGTSGVLRDIISQGYFISATPAVEYHEEHRRAVKEAPLERLLLETDCPVTYWRGSPSEYQSRPAHLLRALKGAAEARNAGEADIARATTGNALSIFGLSLP
ncbi:MAG: TatD family hydrolase [Chloroflexi bacterium]|nr:TatD family hydrolase [Chloroflexota bacterium]